MIENKAIKPALLGGFKDYLPSEMIARDRVISIIRKVYELFGFLPLDTPCIESWDVITGGSNNSSKSIFVAKIIRGEEDKNVAESWDDAYTLRFDLTVSLARVVAAYPNLPKPFKRYQIGKVWRGERPQQGRYREFMQFDADIIGSRSITADIEIICIMNEVMQKIGIDDFVTKINNRKILNGLAEAVNCFGKANLLYRIIDKIDKLGIDGVLLDLERKPADEWDESAIGLDKSQLQIVKSFLQIRNLDADETLSRVDSLFGQDNIVGHEGVSEIRQIVESLKAMGIKNSQWSIDLSVARGLDYYTGPVFETCLTKLPQIGSVFSGGRFDGLTNRFLPNSNIPGVGASVGVDRLIAALQMIGKLEECKTLSSVLVTVFDKALTPESMIIAGKFRSMGIPTELYVREDPLRQQISYGASQGIPFLVIIGPDEITSGNVVLKDMVQRSQQKVSLEEAINIVNQRISGA